MVPLPHSRSFLGGLEITGLGILQGSGGECLPSPINSDPGLRSCTSGDLQVGGHRKKSQTVLIDMVLYPDLETMGTVDLVTYVGYPKGFFEGGM